MRSEPLSSLPVAACKKIFHLSPFQREIQIVEPDDTHIIESVAVEKCTDNQFQVCYSQVVHNEHSGENKKVDKILKDKDIEQLKMNCEDLPVISPELIPLIKSLLSNLIQ
jgi:hypothetical protein